MVWSGQNENGIFSSPSSLAAVFPFSASFVVPSTEVWGGGATQVSPGHDAVTQPGEIHGLPPTALLFLVQAFPCLLIKPAAEC